MSHGDELGNICGNDGISKCSVQQMVDVLCQLDNQHVLKVTNSTVYLYTCTVYLYTCTPVQHTCILEQYA